MLGMAGCAYQGVFRNPLADPYLLGVAAGAGFGATSAIALGAHRSHRADRHAAARRVRRLARRGRGAPTCSAAAPGRGPACWCSRASRWGRSSRRCRPSSSSTPCRTCRRSTVDPRRHRDRQLARRRARLAVRRSSALVMLLHARRARRARARRQGGVQPRRRRPARAPDRRHRRDGRDRRRGVGQRPDRLRRHHRAALRAARRRARSKRVVLPLSLILGGGVPRALRPRSRARSCRRRSCRSASSRPSSARRSSPSSCATSMSVSSATAVELERSARAAGWRSSTMSRSRSRAARGSA